MKIENIISLCYPCSSKYHAWDHFKTLKLKEKIVVSSVTTLVGILSLPFFSLLAVLTFRGLVKKFSAVDLAQDNANPLKETVAKVEQAKKDPIDLLNFNQEKEVPPKAENIDDQKADKIQEEKNEPIANPELKSKIIEQAKNGPIGQLKFNQEKKVPPKAENINDLKPDKIQEEKEKAPIENYKLKNILNFLKEQNATPLFFAIACNDINEVKKLINAELSIFLLKMETCLFIGLRVKEILKLSNFLFHLCRILIFRARMDSRP